MNCVHRVALLVIQRDRHSPANQPKPTTQSSHLANRTGFLKPGQSLRPHQIKACNYDSVHHLRIRHAKRRTLGANRSLDEGGFALALAVAIGLILGLGALALVIRGASALLGSIRQQQSKEALAAAEAGIEKLLGTLNTQYPYLLANNHPSWASPGFIPANVCRNMAGTNYALMPTQGTISNSSNKAVGQWKVISYNYKGNYYYGGNGVLRVEGTRISPDNGTQLAKSQIEEEFAVKYKDCTPKALNAIALLGESVNVGSTSVKEAGTSTPGNVLCTGCLSTTEMNIGSGAIGNFLYGPFPMPAVPTMPAGLQPWDISLNPAAITKDPSSAQIFAGQNRSISGKQVCLVDTDGVTHCRIGSVKLNGSDAATLKIIYPSSTSAVREVRLYTDGAIGLGGNASVCQAIADGTSNPPCTSDPSSVGLSTMSLQWFGSSTCTKQDVKLNGGGNALNMFVYFPCGDVVINGGSNSPDVRGAVWTKTYDSSGSNVDIDAPPDLLSELQKRFGSQFSLSLKRPVAIGVNRWLSFEQVK